MKKKQLQALGFEECDFGFVIELDHSISYTLNHEEAEAMKSAKDILMLITRKAISEGIHVGMKRKAHQLAEVLRVGLNSTLINKEDF